MHVAHGLSHRPPPIEQMDTTFTRAPKTEAKPAAKDSGGIVVVDTIELSAEAEAVLASADQPSGPGKSAQSPAHRARAIIAEHEHLASLSFGDVVSALNHGTLDLTPPVPEPDGETDPVAATESDEGEEADTAPAADTDSPDAVATAETPDDEIDGAALASQLQATVDIDSALLELVEGVEET